MRPVCACQRQDEKSVCVFLTMQTQTQVLQPRRLIHDRTSELTGDVRSMLQTDTMLLHLARSDGLSYVASRLCSISLPSDTLCA